MCPVFIIYSVCCCNALVCIYSMCVTMNIYCVPPPHTVSSDLPVMVWFYGGGFLAGGSMGPNYLNNYLYSGQEIAARGDVIVVSVGYRVGTLGFLSSGDSRLPGTAQSQTPV